jgi:hypothetical protein
LLMGFFIYLPIGFFFGFCIAKINKNLRTGWNLDDSFLIPLSWTALWGSAISMYLVYHRVTLPLPAWLTFGHPVTVRGVLPNVCDDSGF